MKKNEIEIKTLDDEIRLLKIEEYSKEFLEATIKDMKNTLKDISLISIPLILSLSGYAKSKRKFFLITTAGILSLSSIKKLKNNKQNNKEKVLSKGIDNITAEEFYTKEFRKSIEKEKKYMESENYRKYKETLEKQQKKHSNFIVLDNEDDYLTKEETMIQITNEIDIYNIAYKLPPLNISNQEWDQFFDITYNFFEKKDLQKDYYKLISQTERFLFANALLNQSKEINIYNFISNLNYIENDDISYKEILLLQKEILTKLETNKIINFEEYKTKRKIK